jgi:PAS domain S-box-containing protein
MAAAVLAVVAVVALASAVGCALALRRQQRDLAAARTDVARVWERGLARFTESADLLPDILVELDDHQILTFTNQALTRLCGYSEHDLRVGMTLADLLVPEQRPRLVHALAEARDGQPPRAHSFHLRQRDGGVLPVALHLRAVVQGGRFLGWRGLLRDLQATRREQDKPRASHQAAEAVVRGIMKDFARTPVDHHLDVVDRALASACVYLGVDRGYLYAERSYGDRLEGCHLWYAEGVTPLKEDRTVPLVSTYPWVAESFSRGRSLRVPDVACLPTAAAVERQAWLSQGVSALMAVPLRDGERVIGILGCEVFGEPRRWDERDLDVLETIAEICQQMTSRLPRLGELLPDPAFVVDPAGIIVAWNTTLEALTGLSAASRVGTAAATAAAAVLGAEARPLPVQAILADPTAADVPPDLVVAVTRLGQATTLRLSARPLRDPAGRFLGAVQVVQDITQATLAERQLRHRVRETERGLHAAREETRRLSDALEAQRYRASRRAAAAEQAN